MYTVALNNRITLNAQEGGMENRTIGRGIGRLNSVGGPPLVHNHQLAKCHVRA